MSEPKPIFNLYVFRLLGLIQEHGSQTHCAQLEGTTQSNVSQMLKSAERNFGLKLFEKVDSKPPVKALRLTEAGAILAEFGAGCQSAFVDVCNRLAELSTRQKGQDKHENLLDDNHHDIDRPAIAAGRDIVR